MNTALKTAIQMALRSLPLPPTPDYSATAADIAKAIEAEFDVHPNSAEDPQETAGLCWNAGPTPIPSGVTPLCELRSGHTGAHKAGCTHWGTVDPPVTGFDALAGKLFARQAAQDFALAKLAAVLTSEPHSVEDALRLLTGYIAAGGDLDALPNLGTLSATSPLAATMTALAATVDTSSEPLAQAVTKVVQANDVACVVIDQFKKHWPDLYPVLSLRYGIADALWDAGYRSNFTAAAEVPLEEDQRLAAWDELARHPFFASCYADSRPLIDSMVAKLHTVIDAPTTAGDTQ